MKCKIERTLLKTYTKNHLCTMQLLPYSVARILPLLGAVSVAFHFPQHNGIQHVRECNRQVASPTSLHLATRESPDPDNSEKDKNSEGIKNKGLLRLAKLSLEDYQWRQELFRSNEAARRVEESLARMMGDEASYVRPMDASSEKIGPLVSLSIHHASSLKLSNSF